MTDQTPDDAAATLDAIQERIQKQREALHEKARGDAPTSQKSVQEEPKSAPEKKPRTKSSSQTETETATQIDAESTRTSFGASVAAFFAAVGAWIAKLFSKIWGWLKAAGIALAVFVKTKIMKQGETAEAETATESAPASANAKAKNPSAEKNSETESASPKRDFSFLKRKSVIFGGVGAIVFIILLIVGFANFSFVTTKQGIETTLGSSDGRTVLIAKGSTAAQNDLVVAVLPGTAESDSEQLIIGTVFSMNDQTYALYDGEVIWQIPLDEVKGRVLFASATQEP